MYTKLKESYKKAFGTINNIKKIIIFVALLYLIFFIGSLFYFDYAYKNDTENRGIVKSFEEDYGELPVASSTKFFGIFMEIFLWNSFSMLIIILIGPLFGILPVLIIISASIYHGFAMIFTSQNSGIIIHLLYKYGHGFLEIPAFILSVSLSIVTFFSFFKSNSKMKKIMEVYKQSILVYLFVILPLLLIASLIEAFILSY